MTMFLQTLLALLLQSKIFVEAIDNTTDCFSAGALDLIFILDSSGSVYDDGYDNWQSELDFAKAIVNSSLPEDSKVGCINFSDCGSNRNFAQCRAEGKLKKMWGLNEGDDQALVYDRFVAMNENDFNGGYTWTNGKHMCAL